MPHEHGSCHSPGLVTLSLTSQAPADVPKKRVLLVVTPFCSPNYPYPAASYLARYLRRREYEVWQADLSLEVMLRLFCRSGLLRVFEAAAANPLKLDAEGWRMLSHKERYLSTIDTVMRYLKGRDNSIAYRICHPAFLPRGENFEKNFGFDAFDGNGSTLPIHDRAKFVATQYLYDIAGLVRRAIFPYFQITLVDRQYDSFIHWCTTFDKMRAELERPPNVIDQFLHEALDEHLAASKAELVGVSVPFARNVYWALRVARRAKELNPSVKVAMGGGLINTSMRRPAEPRLFDYVDYVTLDDGERPILNILEHMQGQRDISQLKRTFYRAPGEVCYSNGGPEPDPPHAEAGAPDYTGYKINEYFATLETINVLARVRSDGWWNKLTMAHGCYWKKCSFCDVHLSYISDYDTAPVKNLVDKIEEVIAQTGHSGFHFVDEALPPKIMRDFAMEILRRGIHISWHGMLRFDKSFTPDLCRLLAASGLVAVFGGLEVASNRLLQLMKKGTTVEQVALVAKNFQDAGIRVHAYVIYGFPTQTAQETIDALDIVRQLFKNSCITSVSWAKFGVTPNSPIGRNPEEYKIELLPVPRDAFIEQIIAHRDPTGCDPNLFKDGLDNSMRNLGLGLHHDSPVEWWFNFPVPPVSIDRNLLANVLQWRGVDNEVRKDRRFLWLGSPPVMHQVNGRADGDFNVMFPMNEGPVPVTVQMSAKKAAWLHYVLAMARPGAQGMMALTDAENLWRAYGNDDAGFEQFLRGPEWLTVRQSGLLLF